MVSERGHLPKPTQTELSILRVLWSRGRSTVREVHEALNEAGSSGYTTALKMLQVMHGKGLVGRDESGRAHVYHAAVSKEETQSTFLTDLVERLFDGSTSQLVLQAVGNAPNANPEHLDRIQAVLEDIDDV